MSIFLSNSTISTSGVGNFFFANLPSNPSAQLEDNTKVNLPSISELVQLPVREKRRRFFHGASMIRL